MRKLTAVVLVLLAGAAIWWWRMPEERAERLQPELAREPETPRAKAAGREVEPAPALSSRKLDTQEKAARVIGVLGPQRAEVARREVLRWLAVK